MPYPVREFQKSLYKPEYAEQAAKLCLLGATDRELAEFFEVTILTIYRWQSAHKEFFKALERGKAAADARVERSLFSRATGYTFESEKIVTVDNTVQRVPTLEHIPPDVTACIFWLKNRKPKDWRDKTEHDLTLNLKLGADVPLADAQSSFRQLRNATPDMLEHELKLIGSNKVGISVAEDE